MMFIVLSVILTFFVAYSLAVFLSATVFNQDVSKWLTGAVTAMSFSKSLSLCVCVSSSTPHPTVCVFNTTTRESSCQLSLYSHTLCCFVCGMALLLLLWVVLFVSRVAFPLASVLLRTSVQSRFVKLEYGGSDNCGTK